MVTDESISARLEAIRAEVNIEKLIFLVDTGTGKCLVDEKDNDGEHGAKLKGLLPVGCLFPGGVLDIDWVPERYDPWSGVCAYVQDQVVYYIYRLRYATRNPR